jgi:hypothetical protein
LSAPRRGRAPAADADGRPAPAGATSPEEARQQVGRAWYQPPCEARPCRHPRASLPPLQRFAARSAPRRRPALRHRPPQDDAPPRARERAPRGLVPPRPRTAPSSGPWPPSAAPSLRRPLLRRCGRHNPQPSPRARPRCRAGPRARARGPRAAPTSRRRPEVPRPAPAESAARAPATAPPPAGGLLPAWRSVTPRPTLHPRRQRPRGP